MQRFEGVWRKRHLLPSWILQIIGSLVFGACAIVLLSAASYIRDNPDSVNTDDYDYYGYTTNDLVAYARDTGAVVLVMAALTIIFDIVEVVLYKRRTLSPVLLLVLASIKTLVWGAYLILAIVNAARGSVSALDILLSLVLAMASLVQLILAARFTHQKRKGQFSKGKYAGVSEF
ncbi:hypothetical protein F4778DRAFT_242259 [Xylariomycetidae sp. FL2044]|nr:hypothetical protein F4778DRAFT_242259 [Xylariomycetidae sp. FL2044]